MGSDSRTIEQCFALLRRARANMVHTCDDQSECLACDTDHTLSRSDESWEAMTRPPLTAMQKLENIMKGIKCNAKEGVDAERYNWLREHWDEMTGLSWCEPIAEKLDAHIDAAIEAAEKTAMTDQRTCKWSQTGVCDNARCDDEDFCVHAPKSQRETLSSNPYD